MADTGEVSVHAGEILGGKYEVTRLIGRGGMGVVVEAVHTKLRERVAIKVLHERYLENPEAMARFQHEARAAVRIRGEHSARLLDVGTATNGSPFIVMELLQGADLATLVKSGPVSVREAVLYILQACEGMAEVHKNGIVHRDLKPGNLFVTTRNDGSPLVKVLDFGIAKSMFPTDTTDQAMTMTLVSMGTPLYMSPEQVRSSRSVDARADVWSLGVILYELLAGKPAFGGNSVAHITAQVLEAQPVPLTEIAKSVSPELDRVVRKAIAKHPDGRYPDVAAFATALEPFGGARGRGHAERATRILHGDPALGPVSGYPGSTTALAGSLAGDVVGDDDAPTHLGERQRRRRTWLVRAGLGSLTLLTVVIVWLAFDAYRMSAAQAGPPAATKGVQTAVTYLVAAVVATSRMDTTSQRPPPAPIKTTIEDLPDATPKAWGLPPSPPKPVVPGPAHSPSQDDILGTRN